MVEWACGPLHTHTPVVRYRGLRAGALTSPPTGCTVSSGPGTLKATVDPTSLPLQGPLLGAGVDPPQRHQLGVACSKSSADRPSCRGLPLLTPGCTLRLSLQPLGSGGWPRLLCLTLWQCLSLSLEPSNAPPQGPSWMPSQGGALSPLASRTHLGTGHQRGSLWGSWTFWGTRLGCPEQGERQEWRGPSLHPYTAREWQPLQRRVFGGLDLIRGGEGKLMTLRKSPTSPAQGLGARWGVGGSGPSMLAAPRRSTVRDEELQGTRRERGCVGCGPRGSRSQAGGGGCRGVGAGLQAVALNRAVE